MYQSGFSFPFCSIPAGADDSGADGNFGKSEADAPDRHFPNVPTAVSLVAQEAAIEDVSNDSDPEMAKVLLTGLRFHLACTLEGKC